MPLVATETKDFEAHVRRSYASDQPLLERWHIVAGQGLDACVQDTVSVLKDDTFDDFKFYAVSDDDGFVGYFGVEADGHYLTTFFIDPAHRKNKNEFWKLLEPYLQPVFMSAIYSKNLPCVRFYETKGKAEKTFKLRDKDLTLFKFEREV